LDRISIIEVTGTSTVVYLMFLIRLCAFRF
jgi:hypothetical protein